MVRVAPCRWVPCRWFRDGSGPALPRSPVMHCVISNKPHLWNLRDVPHKPPVRRNNPRSFRSTDNDHASATSFMDNWKQQPTLGEQILHDQHLLQTTVRFHWSDTTCDVAEIVMDRGSHHSKILPRSHHHVNGSKAQDIHRCDRGS